MELIFWLLPLGFIVGAFGTLIGAGGGFILVPVLLLLYPDKSPETITCISLAVVFFNSLSGSVAYARMKRIDYKSGLLFAISTVPGSILGALTTSSIPRDVFNGIFGVLLIVASVFLLIKPRDTRVNRQNMAGSLILRSITDHKGEQYTYSYNPVLGVITSIIVGFVSSLLGIGGGIIHVPVLVHALTFPVHIATATSHFVLVAMSLSGTVVHAASGLLSQGTREIIALSVGVVLGAQLGARFSSRLQGVLIIRSLACALSLVGIRILLLAVESLPR